MDSAVELGEAGGLAYGSAGSGPPLVLLHPGELNRVGCWAGTPASAERVPERSYLPVVAQWLEETKP